MSEPATTPENQLETKPLAEQQPPTEEAPAWLEELCGNIPTDQKAEFLKFWFRLKNRHNENDELLALANYFGWLTKLMMDIPERFKITPEMWSEIKKLNEDLDNSLKKLPSKETLERIGTLEQGIANIENATQNIRTIYWTRLSLAIIIPSMLLGAAVTYIIMTIK